MMGRFNRQIILPEIGLTHQLTIEQSIVGVIGCGGLGCPVISNLAAAGIGKIKIFDRDTIELDNLNRQVLFGHADIGKKKCLVAQEKIHAQYTDVQIEAYDFHIDSENAENALANCQIIVDCSDNFECRYATTQAAERLSIPIITGSIYRNEGQILCFNRSMPGYKSYETLFPKNITQLNANNCEDAGVLGAFAGSIGSMMAMEAIFQIIQKNHRLQNEMLLIDCNNYSIIRLKF